MTITVHLVLNAHIDPVWLWPWQSGADEVLATCRSACDRLDNHPDIVFSRGEAWAYRIVEDLDPALFARMRAHIAAGRWEIVGGWWIQPDCNLPSLSGFERQIALGRRYFERRFGQFPRVGFNVDSFGHAAVLPEVMRRHGQDRYVMMRPQEHELSLPARVFRWRSAPDKPEITVFRIARNYEVGAIAPAYVLASLEGLPPGLNHTMCFIGVGDHGGGPTEDQIAWCKQNADAIPGCRLVFSSVAAFFDAVEAERPELPLVTGELQHHAVGCYSVTRAVKTGVRRAEHLLEQAECMLDIRDAHAAMDDEQLSAAWRHVCFNHFHDTLGGTCIPSAYPQAEDQLGAAKAAADDIIQMELRKRLTQLEDSPHQRIVLCNPSPRTFEGYVVAAPWMGTTWLDIRWDPEWRLLDSAGRTVPYQLLSPEAAMPYAFPRLLFREEIAPADLAEFAIDRGAAQRAATREPVEWTARTTHTGIATQGVAVTAGPNPAIEIGEFRLQPRFELRDDSSDTWGHGIDRFDGAVRAGDATWQSPQPLDAGPLMASFQQQGAIADSVLRADWRVYAGEVFAELLLGVHWRARHRILKLCLEMPAEIREHVDGVPGMALARMPDGRERPVRDFALLELKDGRKVGIVCPDVFALDCSASRLGLTLLRSPLMANHTPTGLDEAPRAEVADQGVHFFRFRFLTGFDVTVPRLEQQAASFNYPLAAADLTRGMPPRRVMPAPD